MDERIEILSVSLLDSERETINELKRTARQLKLEFGWHYLLDLSWILSQIDQITNQVIMDAGAGTGVIQWFLADQGATVISVDRQSRENLPSRFRRRFRVEGMRTSDLAAEKALSGWGTKTLKSAVSDWVDRVQVGVFHTSSSRGNNQGKVIIYNQDLTDLLEIQDNSIDTVVAVSSLEHNSPQGLEAVVSELMRVLKPGGALLATLVASRDEDWFHEPSKGWCYSEQTLKRIFQLPDAAPSNYADYDALFEKLVHNQELKQDLASFYSKSGDNGMPWGNWNPEYQPVGVCRIKSQA
ncbi:MAG: class I SAM-dependent methyltransferase [Anaerolineales bacterium]